MEDDKKQFSTEDISKLLAALSGATQLINGVDTMASLGDTTSQQYALNNLRDLGTRDYGSLGQVIADYDRLGIQPNLNFDAIRGMNDTQKVGSALSMAGTGASTGAAIGGVPGAVIGGTVGLLAGGVSALVGDNAARREQQRLRSEARNAINNALYNLNSSVEDAYKYQFKSGINRKDGGQIERKQMTIKEFADAVLNNRKMNTTHSAGIVRQHCNGGTMIRIKMK